MTVAKELYSVYGLLLRQDQAKMRFETTKEPSRMNANETYFVWIVTKSGSAWTGSKSSAGVYDAKRFGVEREAPRVAAH